MVVLAAWQWYRKLSLAFRMISLKRGINTFTWLQLRFANHMELSNSPRDSLVAFA